MKKVLFIPFVCLLVSCTDIKPSIKIHIVSSELKIGDSTLVSVGDIPNNSAYFVMKNEDNPICSIRQITDTSAMLYGIREGEDFLEVYYDVEQVTHTTTYMEYVPIQVVK